MYKDPRGGHNRKHINKDFFKKWTEKMAYVLGYICADGAVEDVRKSSRTCYLAITSVDKEVLEKIKLTMDSTHNLYVNSGHFVKFKKKTYFCKTSYTLRIGSKNIFQDLINLGVTPRKSLRLRVPQVPVAYFNHFLRGYFDGDGCVTVYRIRNQFSQRVQVIFTSGCREYLKKLLQIIVDQTGIEPVKVSVPNNGAYQLRFRKRSGLKILEFMYDGLDKAPYMERKYRKYQEYLQSA